MPQKDAFADAQRRLGVRLLVTGGAGFIGCNLIRRLLDEGRDQVLNLDRLCFPGSYVSIAEFEGHPNYRFVQLDICDTASVNRLFREWQPEAVMHLAAESHVDRSIDTPAAFLQTNILGTYTLLEASLGHWRQMSADSASRFRFHHVSTDEVYGSLDLGSPPFTELTRYDPSSPYSASKASADHLVRAWHHTYGLPVLITNCSNNYGPYQFPDKLIPLMITKGLAGETLPVYGDGSNVRDWLFVDDHARALLTVLREAAPGSSYNLGGDCERNNLEVVRAVCEQLDRCCPDSPWRPHHRLIEFVADRPGHDLRYAMDIVKVRTELGWAPTESFESGLQRTVRWYLDHRDWCTRVAEGSYRGQRLGLGG